MLRKLRVALAAFSFTFITLLFLDFTGALQPWFGWLAEIQFFPAILAANLAVVAGLVVLTLLFGRIYCSVICPLGIMQDIISHFSGKRKNRSYRFHFRKENKPLRYGVLAAFIILLVAGLGSIAALVAPYSAYGKIASNIFAPVYRGVNNLLASLSAAVDGYLFYGTEVITGTLVSFAVAAVTFAVIAVLAWKGGRSWCNNVCPVGTVLGFFSRFSLFRPVIDESKCIGCTKCAKRCKASCINEKEHKIDYSRCVVCMDCISECSVGAIHYAFRGQKGKASPAGGCDTPSDKGRRDALSIIGMAVAGSTLKAQELKVDGGYAAIAQKVVPPREVSPKPAGSLSVKNFEDKCVACQLCVSNCPNGVLRPSSKLSSLLQPEMSFDRGYCRPECTKCGEVCPAGAITKVSREEKSSIQTGHAVWIEKNCVVMTDDVDCGNCAAHCPSGAITMVPAEAGKGRKVPSIDVERCIGCGACEHLCPARPLGAIYVEGHLVHKEI